MTTTISSPPQDRRRKPFAGFLKRLTNLKSSSSHNRISSTLPPRAFADSDPSTFASSPDAHNAKASTVAPSTSSSNGPQSFAETGRTTDTSPAPSLRSLGTLTTVQSTAPPSTYLANGVSSNYNPHASHHHSNSANAPVVLFSHQYPGMATTPVITSTPTTPGAGPSGTDAGGIDAAAIPAIVSGLGARVTYDSATNNNLLTDNASILTLASSSKQRRRRGSLDTDASIRALPPSSLWGGSKESLPLSMLSGAGGRDSMYANSVMGMGGSSVAGPRDGARRGEEADDGRSMRSKRLSLSGTVGSGMLDDGDEQN